MAPTPLDYGRIATTLDEVSLDETVGIPKTGLSPADLVELARWPVLWSRKDLSAILPTCEEASAISAGGAINWSGVPPLSSPVNVDLNKSSGGCRLGLDTLHGSTEWDRLDFNFRDAPPDLAAGGSIEERPVVVTVWPIADADG